MFGRQLHFHIYLDFQRNICYIMEVTERVLQVVEVERELAWNSFRKVIVSYVVLQFLLLPGLMKFKEPGFSFLLSFTRL